MDSLSSAILKYFPVPAYLDVPVAGLSFSDNHIRLIQLTRPPQTAIRFFAEQEIAPGGIVDGHIANKELVLQAFEAMKKTLREKKSDARIERVRVAIPEELGYLFEIKIPRVAPKEVRGTIEFKIEENVPLPADTVLFDYVVIEPESVAETLVAVVSAVPKADIESYIETVSEAGFSVVGIETLSQASAQALLPTDQEAKPVIIAHFGLGKVGLYLVSRGVVRFSSTVTIAPAWQSDPQSVANEIKKVATYWQDELSTDGREVPARIIVCGSQLSENSATILAPFVTQEISLANVWTNTFNLAQSLPEIPFLDSLAYAPTIGSARSFV